MMRSQHNSRRTIFINGRYLTQRMTGVQRYAQELVLGLDRLLSAGSIAGLDVVLVAPSGDYPVPSLRQIQFRSAGRLHGHAWEQLELPHIARGGLLFNPCGVAPIFHPLQVTTLHDASVFVAPEGYSWRFRTWHRLLIRHAAKHARLILTVSEFSKRQLMECCNIPSDRLRVVYQSGSHILCQPPDDSILQKHELLDGTPYVLCVGSQQPTKNFALVARAAALLQGHRVRVVVVGGTNANVFRGENVPSGTLLRTGFVTDAQLRALYEHALSFVFPSLYEGFGIPPLEAMYCGCPVIASNAAAIPEACGDAALYFDPYDPAALAANIKTLLSDETQRQAMIRSGLVRANAFDLMPSVAAIWNALTEIAAQS
jgi:glycosyltransferase involved in cell wall biosynthesis